MRLKSGEKMRRDKGGDIDEAQPGNTTDGAGEDSEKQDIPDPRSKTLKSYTLGTFQGLYIITFTSVMKFNLLPFFTQVPALLHQ